MTVIKDFLGNDIKEGERCIRVHSYSHDKQFKKCTVVKIDLSRKYDPIGIITDGNERIGWTFSSRLIMQEAFKEKI